MIGRSLVALSFLSAAGLLVACGDSGTSTGGGSTDGGSDPGGNNTGAGNTGGENVGAGSQGGNGPDDCGNGTVDAGEDCDGANLDGADCESEGFAGGALACSASCTFDTSDCTRAACGDGSINGTEDCDGTLLGGETCQTQGFDNGTLACGKDCSFDTMGCSDITCGDGTINGTEECDGAMLGGATCETQGFDAGTLVCTNCQFDTAGCLTENCVDTIDNDGDATIDCADTSCAAECADACNTVPVIADPSTTNGDTTGHADVFDASCPADFGGTGGGEVVYQVTAAVTGVMEITLASTADLGVSAWTACGTGEITCDDSDGGGIDEFIEVVVTAGDVVFIGVEGYQPAIQGTFQLDVESHAIVCGDNNIDPGEECDDGGTADGDGCSATCQNECGDGVCGPNENFCTCDADCDNDPDSCEACECGTAFPAGNNCTCDAACIQYGDCCADENASCGTQSVTFSFSATPGVPVVIPDNTYNGMLSSMGCLQIPTASEGTVTSVNSVTVAANHTWIGDLTFKLVSPAGTVVTLMSVPGFIEAADTGASGSSENANLLSTFPITFIPSAAVSAENMGNLNTNDALNVCQPVASGGDGVCQFIPNAGAAAPGTLGASFTGQTSTGNWQLCIGDTAAADTGNITSATINITIGG